MGTARMESFSDGVIAVAITLLALGLTIPPIPGPHVPNPPTLGHSLLHNWPEYAAYVTSFLTIGIIWINHHAMIQRLRVADYPILILNIMLLMTIGLLPFATSLMATYLRAGQGDTLAAAVYGGAYLLMGLAFAALNRHVLIRKPHLLADEMTVDERQLLLRRTGAGLLPYAAATALAIVSPYATLLICAAVAVFYALPVASRLEAE